MITHTQRRTPTADGRRKFPVLLTASLVSSLIMLDSNIVAVSLPSIARSLGATFTDIEWVVSAYVLTFAALLLRQDPMPIGTDASWLLLSAWLSSLSRPPYAVWLRLHSC